LTARSLGRETSTAGRRSYAAPVAVAAVLTVLSLLAAPWSSWALGEPSPAGAPVDSSGIETPKAAAPRDSVGLLPGVLVPRPKTTGPAIVSIRASGFVNVDSIVVVRTFGLSVGQPYDSNDVGDGVKRLYASGLYTDVNVLDTSVEGGVALEVQVKERPRVKEIRFDGAKKIEAKTLKTKITTADGQMLDTGTLELDQGKIRDAYADEGYADAKVTSQVTPAGPGAVDVTFRIEEGPKLKVKGIVVHASRGTLSLEPSQITGSMKSKPPGFLRGGTYKPSQLEQDETQIRLLLHSRGFKDGEVDSIRPVETADGKGVILNVYIREGPRYTFGQVVWSGNTAIPTEALEAATTTRMYSPYSETAVQKTLEAAYALYQERGYLFLNIEPRFHDHGTVVDVEYVVQEGARSRVASLDIVGNTYTKENVIRREASVRPGDTFRRSSLIRTQRDIYALGFFQDVNVDYQPTGDSADINLTLKIKEKQTGTASAGAGFSSSTGITGFIQLGHNNLFGNGQSVQLHLERGAKRNVFEVSYTDPWYHDTPTTVGFSLFNTERNLDVYDRRDVGGGIRVGRPIPWPDFTRVLVSYDLRNVTLFNFVPPAVGESSSLTDLRLTHWPQLVSSVTFTFNRGSTDSPFYPTRGSLVTWINTFAGGPLGGQEEYYKGVFNIKSYTMLQKPFVLMLRGRAGFLGGATTPEYEFFRLGGTTVDYLRGYPDYYIVPRENIVTNSAGQVVERYPGGRKMLIAGAEIQFPIAEPVHGLFFYEEGNTWNSMQDFNLSDMYRAYGFGVRFEVPALGRIGFDVGYGLDRQEGPRWQTAFQLGTTL
jgi:outer membrane protein insertion porin family